jgi:hypothetical protein
MINNEEYQRDCGDRELRGEQKGNNIEEAEERTGQVEEMGKAREIRPENNRTR